MTRKTNSWALRGACLLAFAGLWLATTVTRAQPAKQWRWYKGNLHTHTIHSDGDSSPEFVARWYKEHRYQFLLLSDHNYFTDPTGLNSVLGASERFLLLGGEEVTSRYEKKPVHLNAYGIDKLIPPKFGSSVVDTLQQNVDAILAAGGIPSLNHPNFGWAITPQEMAAIEGLKMFEVYNGHPTVHNQGAGDKPGLEEMWDVSLTAGRRILAVATDDAHAFKTFSPSLSNPGRGWVVVQASELTTSAILDGLRSARFYASTGVELEDVQRSAGALSVKIDRQGNFEYTTVYTGANGKLLAKSASLESSYTLKSSDAYVRATITDSGGRKAWTQPLFR
jgi:hypothetical protein